MITHALLQKQVREHLGQNPALPPKLGRLLKAVQATYHRLEPPSSSLAPVDATGLSLGSVFQSLRLGIIVRGTDGQIIEHNPAAERLLGLSFSQLRGQTPLDPRWRMVQADGRDLPVDQTPARLTLRDGQARHGVIIGIIFTDGAVRWLSFNSDPLHDADNNLLAAVSTFFDVTAISSQVPEIGHPPAAPAVGPRTPRPTLASIAQRLGVSTATVSMALRNYPRISSEMREKVKGIADQLGYRSDPHVQRAMARIRLGRPVATKANLCALGGPSSFADPFAAALIAAARLRADHLGYGFSLERLDQVHPEPTKLTRMLVHRGVDGLLLLPRGTPWDCADLLAWSRFSVVAIGHCVRSPDFDRVTVDWFSTIEGTCADLVGRGYQRVGAVIDSRLDELGGHRIATALAGIHLHLPLEPAPVFHYRTTDGQMLAAVPPVPVPMVISGQAARAAFVPVWEDFCDRLKAWYRRERPEALVIDSEGTALAVLHALGLVAPADLGVTVLNRRSDSQFAGWEERPVKVGEMAIDLLDSKVRQAEVGVPATPSVRMIKGLWRDGPSVKEKLRPTSGIGEAVLFPASAPSSEVSPRPVRLDA